MADVETPPMRPSEKQPVAEATDGRDVSPIAAGRMSTESAAAAKKILEHSGDHDEAMKAFANGEVIEVDEATNKRLLRRIDRFMMPLMCVGMSSSAVSCSHSRRWHTVSFRLAVLSVTPKELTSYPPAVYGLNYLDKTTL